MTAFELTTLLDQHRHTGEAWSEFLRVPALSMGLYTLSAGSRDPQHPHTEDEGYYVVLEIVTEATDLHEVDRFLRLADETVRHKTFRLPDHEATRRGLLGDAAEPAPAG